MSTVSRLITSDSYNANRPAEYLLVHNTQAMVPKPYIMYSRVVVITHCSQSSSDGFQSAVNFNEYQFIIDLKFDKCTFKS